MGRANPPARSLSSMVELTAHSDHDAAMARTQGSHADITRPRLRETALRLFARHGFAAVSMRQIAAEVGVQAGALYLYTPDKQALLFDLMRDHLEHLLADWAPPPASPEQQLESFVRHHIRYHLDRPDLVFIAYMELRNLEPGNFAVIERLRRDYETRLESILRHGKAAGVFDIADTKPTTMALIAMLTGVTTWYREGGRLDRETVETLYWEMARKSVASPPR
jgi:AcrR family transcriptional regulator